LLEDYLAGVLLRPFKWQEKKMEKLFDHVYDNLRIIFDKI
jgi:hypothetical protein